MSTPVRAVVFALVLALGAVTIGSLAASDEAEAAIQHTLTIPAAGFMATGVSVNYVNTGTGFWNAGSGNKMSAMAPVHLQGGVATVQSVELHYLDNGPEEICVSVYRVHMPSTSKKRMSAMCTRNAASGIRSKTDTTIQPNQVYPGQGVYIHVVLPKGSYTLVGVTITYTS